MKQFQIIKPGTKINFLGSQRRFGIASITLIIASIAMLVVNVFWRGSALNYGIDFRGGTQIQIDFQNKSGLDTSAVRGAMMDLKYKRVEVIKAGTEGNAYVIRMENPKIVGQSKKGESLATVLKRRFERTSIVVVLPKKDAAKHADLIAALDKLEVKEAIEVPPVVPTLKPILRVMTRTRLSDKVTSKVVAELKTVFKTKDVQVEHIQIMRRYKPGRSGEEVRLIFTETVSEKEIRDAFEEAKVPIARTAGAVARRGRQEPHKIKWQVRLVGLADRLTAQLNKKLSKFVKATGEEQNLLFALNMPVQTLTDERLLLELKKAQYKKEKPYSLRATFRLEEKRKASDVASELTAAGLTLRSGSKVDRVGAPANKRWHADLAFTKYTPLATIQAAVTKMKAKGALEFLAIRLNEELYRAAVSAAGYGPDDAIALRITFKMLRGMNAVELKKSLKEKNIPLARHRDTIAQVGDTDQNKWLIVLDIRGKDAGMDIDQRLSRIPGMAGITALNVPPHGAVKGIQSVVRVGSKVGRKLRIDGILSVLYTLGLILVYIGLRFDLKFAPGAVLALAHDVIITTGIWAVFWLEFNLSTIAALLTIVGYSLNDTIVVFDRIRENLSRLRDAKLDKVIQTSLNETLSRTLLTSLTTLGSIAAILILASGDLRIFALALTIGVIIGTYSSLYVASPMVLVIDNYFAKRQGSRGSTIEPRGGDGGGDGGGGKRTRKAYQRREKRTTDGPLHDAEARS